MEPIEREYYKDPKQFHALVSSFLIEKCIEKNVTLKNMDDGLTTAEFQSLGLVGYMVAGEMVLRTGYDKNGYYILRSFKDVEELQKKKR